MMWQSQGKATFRIIQRCFLEIYLSRRLPRRPSSDAGGTPRNEGIKKLLKGLLGMTV